MVRKSMTSTLISFATVSAARIASFTPTEDVTTVTSSPCRTMLACPKGIV